MQHPGESREILIIQLELDDDEQYIENEPKMDDRYEQGEPFEWLYYIDLAKEDIWNEYQIRCEF